MGGEQHGHAVGRYLATANSGLPFDPVKPAMQSLTSAPLILRAGAVVGPRPAMGVRAERRSSRAVQPEPSTHAGRDHRVDRRAARPRLRHDPHGRARRAGRARDSNVSASNPSRASCCSSTRVDQLVVAASPAKHSATAVRLGADDDPRGEPRRRRRVRAGMVHRPRRHQRRAVGDTAAPRRGDSRGRRTRRVRDLRSRRPQRLHPATRGVAGSPAPGPRICARSRLVAMDGALAGAPCSRQHPHRQHGCARAVSPARFHRPQRSPSRLRTADRVSRCRGLLGLFGLICTIIVTALATVLHAGVGGGCAR